MEQISVHKSFNGEQRRYRHSSSELNCEMHFSVFLPSASKTKEVPVLYWLSGLTCTDENFVQKAGAQQYAEKYGIALVAPDTSPRGEGVPDDPEGAYDLGLGAGFYLNATQEPWRKHYRMYDYIVDELPKLISGGFPVHPQRQSIFGHSMGGHGAITIALKNADRYRSVSAFSPICSPMNCPWGQKALSAYLGADNGQWSQYDTVALIGDTDKKVADAKVPMMVDQGGADEFLREQLQPELLERVCKMTGYPLSLRCLDGYDHSYFFIATFIEEHIAFHARHLAKT